MTTDVPSTGGRGLVVSSTGQRPAIGLAWQLTGRAIELLARLMANIVLARLLCPEDFGLMGLVVSALAMVDAVTSLATDQAIICAESGHTRRFQSTVFVVAIVRGVVVGTLVVALAPLLAGYYGRPEALPLLAVIGIQPLLAGLANPAATALLRELRFRRWALYRLASALAGIVATVALVVVLRSVWALIAGQLLAVAVSTVGSYLIVSQVPRLQFDKSAWSELRRFSLTVAGTPVLLMLIAQAPALLLGRLADAAILGAFLLNLRLAELPVKFLLNAVSSVFVPVFGRLRSSPERLRSSWIGLLRKTCLVAFPIGAVLGWVGDDLVRVLFGVEYAASPGTFLALAMATTATAPLAVVGALLWGVGEPAGDRRLQLVRLVIVYAAGTLLVSGAGDRGFAIAMMAGAALTLLLGLDYVRPLVQVSWRQIGSALGPGVASGTLTATVLWSLQLLVPLDVVTRIAIGVLIAGTVFIGPLLRWRYSIAAAAVGPLDREELVAG